MRISIWDILSILMIIITLCLFGVFAQIFTNPYTPINFFPPPTLLPRLNVVIPSTTPTLRSLPATWTPTPPLNSGGLPSETFKPSSTIPATNTSYVIPSFTATSTPTNTPTNTPTATNTPTRTPIPTTTPVPTFTLVPTWTLEPTEVLTAPVP